MKGLIRLIKRIFGKYESGYEYWVYVRDIKVNPEWRKTNIGKEKFERKLKYWENTGEFESKIVLDRNFNLVDGYSSLVIAEKYDIGKVPVYFVN